jgi:hypothetical protein
MFLISNYLGAVLLVEPVPRMSTEWAHIVKLSFQAGYFIRKCFCQNQRNRRIKSAGKAGKWLRNPEEN